MGQQDAPPTDPWSAPGALSTPSAPATPPPFSAPPGPQGSSAPPNTSPSASPGPAQHPGPYGATGQFPAPGPLPPPGQYSAPRRTNGFAVASLVLGIVGCFVVTPVLAIVFGVIARKRIAASGGTQDGKGLATAGIVLGALWIPLLVGVVALGSFDFYVGDVDESEIPTRDEFIAAVAHPDETASLRLDRLPPAVAAEAQAVIETMASCTYDALLEEPRYLIAVYEDPSPDAGFHFVRGVSQKRINEIDDEVFRCQDAMEDRFAEIAGG